MAPGRAIGQWRAICRQHKPACGLEDTLPRSGVPFHGRAETRIEIRFTRRDETEFDRRPHPSCLCTRKPRQKHIGRMGVVRRTGKSDKGFRPRRADGDAFPKPRAALEGTLRPAEKNPVEGRGKNHAEPGNSGFDQRDIDRITRLPGHEILCSVKRINQKEPPLMVGRAAGSDLFFGNHRNVGRKMSEPGEDQGLGLLIGDGNRGAVLLGFDRKAGSDDLADPRAGLFGDAGQRQDKRTGAGRAPGVMCGIGDDHQFCAS